MVASLRGHWQQVAGRAQIARRRFCRPLALQGLESFSLAITFGLLNASYTTILICAPFWSVPPARPPARALRWLTPCLQPAAELPAVSLHQTAISSTTLHWGEEKCSRLQSVSLRALGIQAPVLQLFSLTSNVQTSLLPCRRYMVRTWVMSYMRSKAGAAGQPDTPPTPAGPKSQHGSKLWGGSSSGSFRRLASTKDSGSSSSPEAEVAVNGEHEGDGQQR